MSSEPGKKRLGPPTQWWMIVCALLGMTFIGWIGWLLAFLIPGIQELRAKESVFFQDITAEEQPRRYWFGIVAWFGLALLVLLIAFGAFE